MNKPEHAAILSGKFGFISIKKAINNQKVLLKIAAIVAIATSFPLTLGVSSSLAAPLPACVVVRSTIRSITVKNNCKYAVGFRVVPLGGETFPPTCYNLAPGQTVRIIVPFDRFRLEQCGIRPTS